MPDKHALISPSSSHRWLVCPGSVKANADKPFTQNDYALLGTSAHALLETCLRLKADPTDFLGKVLERGHMPVDEDMADGVGYALDYVQEYMANNPKAKFHAEKQVYMDVQLGLETPDDPEDGLCWGTSDIVIDNYPAECVVIDYKHGTGVSVSVKGNTQLLMYATGMRQLKGRYRRYRKVVIQPRVEGRKPVQEASITDKELSAWLDKTVKPVIPIVLGDDPPRVAGGHCRWCHADGKCPEQYKTVQKAAAEEFSVDPKGLTPADIAKTLDAIDRISPLVKAIEKHAITLLHAGVNIPGWVKDFTAPRRLWVDEDKTIEILEKMGLSKRERYSIELLSPAQAEKAIRAKGNWPKKPRGSAAEDFVNPFQDVVGYTESNPTYARAK